MTKLAKQSANGVHPFLRWAGSKRLLLPRLASYWDQSYKRYIEPFAGSARLFFHLCPRRALLGDINTDLIHTYRELKADPDRVLRCLAKWRSTRTTYYRVRSMRPESLPSAERAARFIYLNRFCFNGLYRTNLKGVFNVPFGGGKSGRIPDQNKLMQCSSALTHTTLVAGDFQKVLRRARSGDFVYMDPPFSTNTRRIFTEYDKSGFGRQDIVRLRESMQDLASRGVSFLVSYIDCPEADYLSDGFSREKVSVKRSIAGFTGSREQSPEVLISFR